MPRLHLVTLEIPHEGVQSLLREELPTNWSAYPAPSILAEMGSRWAEGRSSLALRVPSCIVHSAHNILLNCRHPDFGKVRIIGTEPFHFDVRLAGR